jgi:hypothetical protein
MDTMLFRLYLANAILLIIHEIDSAYWKEWELFRLPGGISGFLGLHVPLLFVILYGLVELERRTPAGLIYSLLLSAGGVFAFIIHLWFIRRGRPEFKTPTSLAILILLLIGSLIQMSLTVTML